MNNRLFSILLAIVMISSVCVIPIASDNETDAASDDTNIKDGDIYGVHFNLTNESLVNLIHEVMPTSSLSDDLVELLNFLFAKEGIEFNTLVLDLEVGFAVKYVGQQFFKTIAGMYSSFSDDPVSFRQPSERNISQSCVGSIVSKKN